MKLDIAHIHEQGQDIIIIPLSSSLIHHKSSGEQNAICDFLQDVVSSAGLKGVVCVVWEVGSTFYFIAPKAWQNFFKSINMDFVRANLNRTLTYS